MDWPDGFWWGTGASSTQCEGASPASDWWAWEEAGRVPRSGDGNGFATRYAEDFATLAGLGLTHHRLSIDWARIEPREGQRDQEAVAHYRRVLEAAHACGIVPWVCLHHFVLPQWIADRGGFLDPATRTEHWRRHVDFVAETFGDLVGGWQPVNEMNLYPTLAYRLGMIPPFHADPDEWAQATEEVQLATAEAAVRLKGTGVPVASIFGLLAVTAADDEQSSRNAAAELLADNEGVGLGLFRDGVLEVPGREPIERPDLAGAFDLIGFSYYISLGFRAGALVGYPDDAPTSPLGYSIWADGLGQVLRRLHATLPGVPLLVAEYGIGTDDDDERVAYLERGLEVVHEAIADGIDVRGLFHWTAVDNYEWMHGYDVRFGIIDRDRNVRASAQVLAREARG